VINSGGYGYMDSDKTLKNAWLIHDVREKVLVMIGMCAELSGTDDNGNDNSNEVDLQLSQIARNWAEVYDILSPKVIKKED
jgi:hypothetical protein